MMSWSSSTKRVKGALSSNLSIVLLVNSEHSMTQSMFMFCWFLWQYLFLFRPFGFLSPKDFTIIWLSNILALSVPDKGYFKNASCALNLTFTFLLTFLSGSEPMHLLLFVSQCIVVRDLNIKTWEGGLITPP